MSLSTISGLHRVTKPKMDTAHQAEAETTVNSDLEVLRRKRKARGQRACYPCRQRKVRCNYETPCKTCVDRDHPELCRYQLPSKRSNIDSTENLHTFANHDRPSASEGNRIFNKLDEVEQSLRELKEDLRRIAAGGQPTLPHEKTSLDEWTFDGSNSKAADTGAQGIH